MKKLILLISIFCSRTILFGQIVNHLNNSGNGDTYFRATNMFSGNQGLEMGILQGNNGNGNPGFINLTEDNFLFFGTDDTERVRILSTGEVGIGTTSPTQRLHVQGGTRITSLSGTGFRLVQANGTGVLSTIPDGTSGQVLTTNGSGVLSFQTLTGGGAGGADHDWYDITSGNTTNSPPTINEGVYTFGNVGVNWPTPTANLHVDEPNGGDLLKLSVSGRPNSTQDAFIFNATSSNSTLKVKRGSPKSAPEA